MKVTLVNNDGGGFAETHHFAEGTTVEQAVKSVLGAGTPVSRYTIRVNSNPVTSTQVLREGDRILIAPNKMSGAAA